jgi:hypothetical protein
MKRENKGEQWADTLMGRLFSVPLKISFYFDSYLHAVENKLIFVGLS